MSENSSTEQNNPPDSTEFSIYKIDHSEIGQIGPSSQFFFAEVVDNYTKRLFGIARKLRNDKKSEITREHIREAERTLLKNRFHTLRWHTKIIIFIVKNFFIALLGTLISNTFDILSKKDWCFIFCVVVLVTIIETKLLTRE